MGYSKSQIWNKALGYLGVRSIVDLDNTTQAGRVGLRVFDQVFEDFLREHDWGFATVIETLNQVNGATVPGWNYIYKYPPKCMRIIKLFEDTAAEVPVAKTYKEVFIPALSIKALCANITPAYVEYVYQINDVTLVDPSAAEALALKLAAAAAQELTGDPALGESRLNMYLLKISDAKRLSVIEQNLDNDQVSAYVDVRS